VLGAQFAWLGDGGDKALVGRDGWLFYRPGVEELWKRTPAAATPHLSSDPLPAIVAFRDELAARGIHLLVLPVPNKESVYPDQLTRRVAGRGGLLAPRTRDLLRALREARVAVVDLFGQFAEARQTQAGLGGPSLYLVQDSHWSPAGLELAARAAAQHLLDQGSIRRGPTRFDTRPSPVRRTGDILRMLQAPQLERLARSEEVTCRQVLQAGTGQLYADDPNAEVLVLGDSFLRIYEQDEPGAAGFIAHLARELGQPVTSLVSDGGASTLVRQELHRRPALLRNKKVVVWEFVERDIGLGQEGWQIVPLPPPGSSAR
jgi:hypothetical protein